MNALSQWVLSVAAVALVGVVADIILPEGQIQKYCRSVFALIMLLVIITPIPKLLKADLEFTLDGGSATNIQLDENYLQSVYRARLRLLEQTSEAYLEQNECGSCSVQIFVNEYSLDMKIISVKLGVDSANSKRAVQLLADFLSVPQSYIVAAS